MAEHDISTKIYNSYLDELHFINQIIRNMHLLERMYSSGISEDPKELFGVQNALQQWYHKQEKVMDEINDMQGYGSYDPDFKVKE
jgi:hypothetical protein